MSDWYDIPKRATPFRAARVRLSMRAVELRLYEGYTGGRLLAWLAIRWHGPDSHRWESRCTQYSGRNYRSSVDDFEKNLADGRRVGATITEGRTMRDVWDQAPA